MDGHLDHAARQRVYVGFGGGALGELGELDTEGQKTSETKLDAHPESFQLEKGSSRACELAGFAEGPEVRVETAMLAPR